MNRIRFVSTVAAIWLIATAAAVAGEGRIPIFEPIVLDGTTTSISGRYVVTRDITATGTDLAIDIIGTGTENIEIDLNGFTVSSAPPAGVIRVGGGGLKHFNLRNGSVVSSSTDGFLIDVVGSLPDETDSMHVENVTVVGGTAGLYSTYVSNVIVRHNMFHDSAMVVWNGGFLSSTLGGFIERNVFRGANFEGILLSEATSLTIRNNEIRNPSNAGIFVRWSNNLTIVGNNVEGGSDGIYLEGVTESSIRENTLSGNDDTGIRLTAASSRNLLENNLLNSNGTGLIFLDGASGDNVYRGNVMLGNLSAPASSCPGQNNAPAPCAAPAVCDLGTGNITLGDNVAPVPGC